MDALPTEAVLTSGANRTPKELAQKALEANKAHQYALTKYAERLMAELKDVDKLLGAADVDDGDDESEMEIQVPGAKKAAGPCPIADFLSPDSPFFEEASRRTRYMNCINDHPMKLKELEALADAVRCENIRLQAHAIQRRQGGQNHTGASQIDLENNTEGLDWALIAEKVSNTSNVKRSSDECRIKWLGDKHPEINHGEWTAAESEHLKELVSGQLDTDDGKVDWVYTAKKLGTNRTPVECMRRGLHRQRHLWDEASDDKLLNAVKLYGTDNWSMVARYVSEDATPAQCHGRYVRALNPSLKRGNWPEEEYARLKLAVAAYGNSWMDVANCIAGRTREQCRDRWSEHLTTLTTKSDWTEEDDEALLSAVNAMGNQWKAISAKIGNGRTSVRCRLRYEKLRKQRGLELSPAGRPSNRRHTIPQPSGDTDISVAVPRTQAKPLSRKVTAARVARDTNEAEASSILPVGSRPKPRPVGKRKDKEKAIQPDSASTAQTVPNGSNAEGPIDSTNDSILSEAATRKKRKSGGVVGGEAHAKKKKTSKTDVIAGNYDEEDVDDGEEAPTASRIRPRQTHPHKDAPKMSRTRSSPRKTQNPAGPSTTTGPSVVQSQGEPDVSQPKPHRRLKVTLHVRPPPLAEAPVGDLESDTISVDCQGSPERVIRATNKDQRLSPLATARNGGRIRVGVQDVGEMAVDEPRPERHKTITLSTSVEGLGVPAVSDNRLHPQVAKEHPNAKARSVIRGTPPRRQSARVAAKKSISFSGPEPEANDAAAGVPGEGSYTALSFSELECGDGESVSSQEL